MVAKLLIYDPWNTMPFRWKKLIVILFSPSSLLIIGMDRMDGEIVV